MNTKYALGFLNWGLFFHAWKMANLEMSTFAAEFGELPPLVLTIKIYKFSMKESQFLYGLADIIIGELKSEKYPLLEREVKNLGHFHYQVLQREKVLRQLAPNLIRMLMNMAMGMRERDFRNMCQRIVDRIVEVAESADSDVINAEHELLKKRNR